MDYSALKTGGDFQPYTYGNRKTSDYSSGREAFYSGPRKVEKENNPGFAVLQNHFSKLPEGFLEYVSLSFRKVNDLSPLPWVQCKYTDKCESQLIYDLIPYYEGNRDPLWIGSGHDKKCRYHKVNPEPYMKRAENGDLTLESYHARINVISQKLLAAPHGR